MGLFREARSINSVPYSFLGYFKIIGIICKTKSENAEWINERLDLACGRTARERLKMLRKEPDVGRYLYESGRCAVANAYEEPLINPDESAHVRRLQADHSVIKDLASYLMATEMKLPRDWLRGV